MRLILDAHLDLAWNALSFDRDQTLPIDTLRAREAGMEAPCRGKCTASLPEMRKAGVGICLATILARTLPQSSTLSHYAESNVGKRTHGAHILRDDLDFASQTITCAVGESQATYYRLLEDEGEMRMIRTREDLTGSAEAWQAWLHAGGDASGTAPPPIGYILSMEGADPIRHPREAGRWFDLGLRTACLSHYGPSVYSMGTGGNGPLTPAGIELVKEFDRLGIILDLVHTADLAVDQALEHYGGPVFVSHGNARTLVPHDRQMNDAQIRTIADRKGVIGIVLDSWMIVPDYQRGCAKEENPSMEQLADHIDHICQVQGGSEHVGIGSDLDGGFGFEQTPKEVFSIQHLHLLEDILGRRGYSDAVLDGIFHGNFLRFFGRNLPGAADLNGARAEVVR